MVAIEYLMLSCIIKAKEGRNVATADIPGAFMQTEMKGTVHMVLEGTMAELWSKLTQTLPKAPSHQEGEASNARTAKEGAIWYATSRARILEGGMGL
jgi:hypothetical protein